MDSLTSGLFTPGEDKNLFVPIFQNIMFRDYYMLLGDFEAYLSAQDRISADYMNHYGWAKKALINIARSGKFSIDRTVMEYARDIWHVKPSLEK